MDLSTPTLSVSDPPIFVVEEKLREGNLFTQKPRLACHACNTGWMADYERELSDQLKLALFGASSMNFSKCEEEKFIGWLVLILILSEYLKPTQIVTLKDRILFKETGMPSDNWTIFIASVTGPIWNAAWTRQTMRIWPYADRVARLLKKGGDDLEINTQLVTLGMGRLFVHAFYTPQREYAERFEIAAKTAGLTRVWPKRARFWPFTKWHLHLPLKLSLSDDNATEISEAFYFRLKALHGSEQQRR